LLIPEQLGVAHDIDEQDMPDLQTGLFFGSGHSVSLDGGRRDCRDHSFGVKNNRG